MNPFFADISNAWMLGCTIVMTVVCLASLAVTYFKKTDTQISPQPLIVAMEKEFTTKNEFANHNADNRREHENIFARMGGIERGARTELQKEIASIQHDRQRSLETLNRRNERVMFALGKIASKLDVDIEPTE